MTCEILLGCRLTLSPLHLSISIMSGGQGHRRTGHGNASVSTVVTTKYQYFKEDSSYWHVENEL